MARRPLPSAGSLGSVPPRRRYYEALRIPAARPAALRCLRLAVSRSHPHFVPVAAECAGREPGVGHPVPPAGTLPRRRRGLPGSWGTPVSVPCSPTPAGSHAPGHCGAATRLSVPLTTSAPAMRSFRGSIARPAHWLSTLRSPGRPGTTQDSLPAAGQALPGGGRYPAGFHRKVSALHPLPPFPSFPGALKGETLGRIGGFRSIGKEVTSIGVCEVWIIIEWR